MKATKKDCIGCRDNFYNGNNNLGVLTCFSFNTGYVKKRYAIDTNTPSYQENFYQVSHPACYHRPGTVYVDNVKNYPKRP